MFSETQNNNFDVPLQNQDFSTFFLNVISGKLPPPFLIDGVRKSKHYILLPPYHINSESPNDLMYKSIGEMIDAWGEKRLCQTLGNTVFPIGDSTLPITFGDSVQIANATPVTWNLEANGDPVGSVSLDKTEIIMLVLRGKGSERHMLLTHFNTMVEAYLFQYNRLKENSIIVHGEAH